MSNLGPLWPSCCIFQVIDLTGCTQDKAEIALFDNKNDITRAVNMLLEGEADQVGTEVVLHQNSR